MSKHNILTEISSSTANVQTQRELCLGEVLGVELLQFNVLEEYYYLTFHWFATNVK